MRLNIIGLLFGIAFGGVLAASNLHEYDTIHAMLRLDEDALIALLVNVYVDARKALLADVYDALGVPHEGGELDEDTAFAMELSEETGEKAASALVERQDVEDLWLCFTLIAARPPMPWLPALSGAMLKPQWPPNTVVTP